MFLALGFVVKEPYLGLVRKNLRRFLLQGHSDLNLIDLLVCELAVVVIVRVRRLYVSVGISHLTYFCCILGTFLQSEKGIT